MSTHTSLKLAECVEEGLPTESLSLLREEGFTFTEMAPVIPPRILKHCNARGENLSTEEAVRPIRIASIVGIAEQVFGGRLIEAMLWDIGHGIFS